MYELLHLLPQIGIIGGSGFDDPDILHSREEKTVDTPFGQPSDALVTGEISGVPCVLLARHGRRHALTPTNVNYRANIHALKQEGCTHILATTACGSLREDIHPGDIVILDQFIDRTFKREPTFYDGAPGHPYIGVCHIQMDQPFCHKTRSILIQTARQLGLNVHERGTTVTVEGPRFSSKAESFLFQSWGCHVVNMTTVPEVCLAKEAGMCYASIGLPTDYDCWKDEPVNVEMVMKTLRENGDRGRQLLVSAVGAMAKVDWTADVKELQDVVKASVMMP